MFEEVVVSTEGNFPSVKEVVTGGHVLHSGGGEALLYRDV